MTRRGIHTGEISVSKDTEKAIADREKSRAKLNAKIEKAAEKANKEEKDRA